MKVLWIAVLSVLVTGTLYAQDITGDWQGTLKTPAEERLIVRIKKELDGSLQVRMVLVDRGARDWGAGVTANTVSLEGSTLSSAVCPKRVFSGVRGYHVDSSAESRTA
jgi:hypothetical protein